MKIGSLLSRRSFLGTAAAGAATLWSRTSAVLHLGVMDTTLQLAGKPEAVALAKRLGFDGIQVTLGGSSDGVIRFRDTAVQQEYAAALREHKLTLASTYLDILHRNCLKNDQLAPKWVAEGIEITRKLGAPILMLVFFGKCAIHGDEEMDAVAARLKELAPVAEKAGITLGFENLLKAGENERVLDRVGSPALKVYYDIGNLTNTVGVDPAAEIRRLGAKRICQFHIKDKRYLGEGKVDVVAAMRAMADTGFQGFAMLETPVVASVEEDARRNLAYARQSWRTATSA